MLARIVLTGNPQSTNHLYKMGRSGLYMNDNGKVLKTDYWVQATQQYKTKPIDQKIKVEMQIFFSDRIKRDVDNYSKIILDSLNKVVWVDDSLIVQLCITKNYDKMNPRAELIIKKI